MGDQRKNLRSADKPADEGCCSGCVGLDATDEERKVICENCICEEEQNEKMRVR